MIKDVSLNDKVLDSRDVRCVSRNQQNFPMKVASGFVSTENAETVSWS